MRCLYSPALFDRHLSPGEVADLYAQAVSGYPDTLRFSSPRSWHMPEDTELQIAERAILTPQERQTLEHLRIDADSGPALYADAVALIERLIRDRFLASKMAER